jgi:hypothetical protein
MAHCRHGALGYNYGECTSCKHKEWYASSCGDRHCPMCLGSRQIKWSQQVCDRLPDCPHFHVVFSPPAEFWKFFEDNYRLATDLLFAAAAETLKKFQRNNWGCEGGFFGVLHTWGSALNWHPHLHCLVSGGGRNIKTGRWMKARSDYLFPVQSMSKVFAAILLRKLEEHDADDTVVWPQEAQTLEQRRGWRQLLARKTWVVYSKATLGNTRAVVRYLARYTSRIAMSNHRIVEVDEEARRVKFSWKDYRDGGKTKIKELSGKDFIRRFTRHLVPESLRRIRYYGLLTGRKDRFRQVPGAPQEPVGEQAHKPPPTPCPRCEGTEWVYGGFWVTSNHARRCVSGAQRFSLYGASAIP